MGLRSNLEKEAIGNIVDENVGVTDSLVVESFLLAAGVLLPLIFGDNLNQSYASSHTVHKYSNIICEFHINMYQPNYRKCFIVSSLRWRTIVPIVYEYEFEEYL